MHRSIGRVIVVGSILWFSRLAWSQDDPQVPAQPAAKDQLAALIARQNTVADQYNAILRGIKQQPDLVTLEAEVTAAQQAVAAAEANDQELREARAAQQAAVKSLRVVVEQKLAEHPAGGKALAQRKTLRDEQAGHQWAEALAQFQLDSPLSPLNRALADDRELVELQAKLVAAVPAERATLQATLQQRRREKVAEREDGKMLLAMIEIARNAAAKLTPAIASEDERLATLRRELEAVESAGMAKTQAAVDRALGKERLQQLRAAHGAAIDKYNVLVKEKLAADPQADRLKGEYDQLAQQVRELRAATKKPAK